MTYDPTDPMNAYTSRRTAKVIRESDLQAKRDQSEWAEQLRFCKWLKHAYPDILFRSDIQSAGKLSPQMQNIKQIIDPYSGWPDVTVYSLNLMIEMKRIGANMNNDHARNQVALHFKLRKLGWRVHVAFGAEEAKRVFLEYLEM